jgi:hypothetical protein
MKAGKSTGTAAQPAKMPAPPQDVKPDETPSQELRDRIEQRAYRLYEERGYQPGHDVEDWLQAEQEVLAEGMDTDLG